MSEIIDKIRSKRVRVAVIGDSMIDVYHYGKVSRISPEFPVPILHSKENHQELVPGGAANVCYQFSHLNAKVHLFAPLDLDALNIFKHKFNFDVSGCPILPDGSFIPKKIRYYDDNFPLLRNDIEKPNYGLDNLTSIRESLFSNFIDYGQFDVVILSNYNKGLFDSDFTTKILSYCRKHNIPTVVDPKNNPEWWWDCDYFKPNAAEAEKMTGRFDWKQQCEMLKNCAKKGIVITQSGSGVVGMDEFGELFEYRPRTTIKDVSSVIGAGDAFSAVMGLSIAHGLPLREAVKCAFEAGTQYVKARHNRPIALYELHRQLDPLNAKIVPIEELARLRNGVYKDYRWVFSNGCFDLGIHVGHIATLQAAKSRGDKLIVAVNSDESVKRLKGPTRPIVTLNDRMKTVAALECVDFVVSFEKDVPYNVIDAIRPNVLVKGSDWANKTISGVDLVDEVFLVDYIQGLSTTSIIEKIKQNG